MNDQPFAGKYLQSRRRIEIAARLLPVRCRALDDLIIEKEKVLDRRGYRIERGLSLSRREPNFKNAFLARQHHRFSELRSNCEVCSCLGGRRPDSRLRRFKHHQECEGTDYKQAKQTTRMERVVE